MITSDCLVSLTDEPAHNLYSHNIGCITINDEFTAAGNNTVVFLYFQSGNEISRRENTREGEKLSTIVEKVKRFK